MSLARVIAVAPRSPAARAGLQVGDSIVAISGEPLRDVIQYRVLTDAPEVSFELQRGGLEVQVDVTKRAGEPLGIDVDAAVFDQVRTCDNHCEFCFIYQLPPGLRHSLYLKDDDYRLSFLYGNFTTLTRFTEADLERVVTEGLSPLYVSIHATDPDVRADLLRNRRGGVSLRWLRQLLDHGVEVFGQIVVCPGLNDGAVLEDTFCGVLDEYPELRAVAVVPLGVSAHNREPRMRPHGRGEAEAVVDLVESWQASFLHALGRRTVFAADEYHLLAGRPFPPLEHYEGAPMHEDGIGMAATFAADFRAAASGLGRPGRRPEAGFFAWADGARAGTPPPNPCGYRPALRPARRPGLGWPRRSPAPGAPARWPYGPGGGRRSASSPAATAPACSAPCWRASVAPTCGSWRSTTASSAATSAWRG